MSSRVLQEVTEKTASLPLDLQREVLDFVEFMLQKTKATIPKKTPFRSVRGIFSNSGVKITEEDIAEVRREMWNGFPREEPR
jgi:hypothetical protein